MERYKIESRIHDIIVNSLNWLDASNLIWVFNQYCENVNYMDDYIYQIEEIDDLFCGCSPLEVLEKCAGINTNDDYVRFTIWGAESTNDPADWIDLDELADNITDDWDAYAGILEDARADYVDEITRIFELMDEIEEQKEDIKEMRGQIEAEEDAGAIEEIAEEMDEYEKGINEKEKEIFDLLEEME